MRNILIILKLGLNWLAKCIIGNFVLNWTLDWWVKFIIDNFLETYTSMFDIFFIILHPFIWLMYIRVKIFNYLYILTL